MGFFCFSLALKTGSHWPLEDHSLAAVADNLLVRAHPERLHLV